MHHCLIVLNCYVSRISSSLLETSLTGVLQIEILEIFYKDKTFKVSSVVNCRQSKFEEKHEATSFTNIFGSFPCGKFNFRPILFSLFSG